MSEQDIISLYNDNVPTDKQTEDNYIRFMKGLVIDNIISLKQFEHMTEV